MTLAQLAVELSRYKLGKKIGDGGFGTVYEAEDTRTGKRVAIKFIKNALASSDTTDKRGFIRELSILATNRHPATLCLRGFTLSAGPGKPGDGPVLVTDLMRNGTLSAALKREREKTPLPGWTPTKKSICLFGIVATMAYIHEKQIIHRDLKPENVFLNDDFEPCLADFGISRHCTASLDKTAELGTPLYMAPELLDEEGNYDEKVDVYAFAVTLYQFFAHPNKLDDNPRPLADPTQLLRRVQKGARFVRVREIGDYHWGIIDRCWRRAPMERPSFQDLVEEFRANHDYKFPGTVDAELIPYEDKILDPFDGEEIEFEEKLNQFLDECEIGRASCRERV
jgi:serine/threonine protein kinase